MRDGVYKIKTWKKMEEEYGTDKDGDILGRPFMFVKAMEEDMPPSRIIYIKGDVWKEWIFADYMIEEAMEDSSTSPEEPPMRDKYVAMLKEELARLQLAQATLEIKIETVQNILDKFITMEE